MFWAENLAEGNVYCDDVCVSPEPTRNVHKTHKHKCIQHNNPDQQQNKRLTTGHHPLRGCAGPYDDHDTVAQYSLLGIFVTGCSYLVLLYSILLCAILGRLRSIMTIDGPSMVMMDLSLPQSKILYNSTR